LTASLLIALALPAAPATSELDTQAAALDATAANKGQTLVAGKIAAFFTNLAGSKDNANALVVALRNGTDVNLTTTTGTGATATTTTTTFTPPTGKMGWGNVKIALALAQDSLLRAGITNPTPAQLQAALDGGTVTKADGTTVTLKGVLQMRADGMGWGQIAQAGGTKVGPVVSSLKSTQAQLASLPAGGSGITTATSTGATTKGVTTAAGASGGKGPSKGITTATGAGTGGIVTAEGAGAGNTPKGNAYGRGLVTGTGSGIGTGVVASGGGKPSTTGVVTATGGVATSVTTPHGNNSGNGQGDVHGKGKGGG
jgi:hypothetical protein